MPLIAEWARRQPSAEAVRCGDASLSYAEFESLVRAIVLRLRDGGLAPESVVGLLLERSTAYPAAMLATMEAGGAFLPLDTDLPSARLQTMIRTAEASCLVTERRFEVLAIASGLPYYLIEDCVLRHFTDEAAWEVPTADDARLAYVICTSGTSGTPKVVALERRALLSYANALTAELGPAPGMSFAMVNSPAADLGYTAIFGALLSGATLHLLPRDIAGHPRLFAAYMERHAVDFLKIVPSHLEALLHPSAPEGPLPRRALILGGEETPAALLRRLTAAAACAIYNHYGPSESCVGVAFHRFDPLRHSDDAPLPLSKALGEAELLLLDDAMQPVEEGEVGQLYIGGPTLARAYRGQPSMTASRFIPHPNGTLPGGRLYRSGDLFRRLPDGGLQFCGRNDSQLKVRGLRVESREVEATLRAHPAVAAAAVDLRRDHSGTRRLMAWLVPADERAAAIAGSPRFSSRGPIKLAQLNQNETDYIWREIFELRAYVRHGIQIRAGDCVVDVGANIGLFSLFAHQLAGPLRLFALEPNPEVSAALRANAAMYGVEVECLDIGLSDSAKTLDFTYFPQMSLLSGIYADAAAEGQVVKAYLRNQQHDAPAEQTELLAKADELIARRFQSRSIAVRLQTLSWLLREYDIDTVDLLKINVEKSELDVLRGIDNDDWSKIRQLVIEVDSAANLAAIDELLQAKGYETLVEQDELLRATELHYIYAIRPTSGHGIRRGAVDRRRLREWPEPYEWSLPADDLRQWLRRHLPEQMLPARLLAVDRLPRGFNQKVDREALQLPDETPSTGQSTFCAPRNAIEERVAECWQRALGGGAVGVDEHFEERGGDSLRAITLLRELDEEFAGTLGINDIFDFPTVAKQASLIEGRAAARFELSPAAEAGGAMRRVHF